MSCASVFLSLPITSPPCLAFFPFLCPPRRKEAAHGPPRTKRPIPSSSADSSSVSLLLLRRCLDRIGVRGHALVLC